MRHDHVSAFIKGIVLVQIILVMIIAGLGVELSTRYGDMVQGITAGQLFSGLNNLSVSEHQAQLLFGETNCLLGGQAAGESLIELLLKSASWENMMGSHIVALAYSDATSRPVNQQVEGSTPEDLEVDDTAFDESGNNNTEVFKDSRIYLYCTHSAETYVPDSGTAKLDGQRGLVNKVAAILAHESEKNGLPAAYIDTIHDFPDYNKSYTNSRQTVSDIVEENRDVAAIFDIHRDSIPDVHQASTIKINGEKCAQILIIVGTDERKPHPNWRKNQRFAQELYQQAEKMYPGLIKGVRTKAGTYNQEFHEHALLLEFGTDYNTLGEAGNAAKYFSKVLVEVLKGQEQATD